MLKQRLQQKLQQKLSPQQIQLMKLVQLPTLAFEQRVKEELEDNPALEDDYDNYEDNELSNLSSEEEYNDYEDNNSIDTSDINLDEYMSDDEFPSYKTQDNNYKEEDDKEIPFEQSVSFQDTLLSQLHTYRLSDEDYLIADFLIGNLDEDGYLRREISSIVDDLIFNVGIISDDQKVEYLLKNYIQKLEPEGIGARDLKECLLIQLSQKKQTPEIELAIKIITDYFEPFSKKHYDKIIAKLGVTENELKSAIQEIEKLNPRPGGALDSFQKNFEQITPDFTINIVNGKLELALNGRNAPELKVSRDYIEMFDTYKKSENKSKEQKDAVLFVKQKLDSARWFIDAIKQRQNTLFQTMKAIMEYQKEYFLSGDEMMLKPMILKDIADKINMDISTVSRVANSKYVITPYGTILIKDLFSESMTNDEGEEISTKEIKAFLQQEVDKENKRKPLTDHKLTQILTEKGYNIARRTIAKYREQLNIPVARLRKEI